MAKKANSTITNVFRNAFHFFEKNAVPAAESGLSIAAAVSGDPRLMAADKIVHLSAPILSTIVEGAENGNVTISQAQALELAEAIRNHGATVNQPAK